jgi:hypothetical protein
VPRERLERAGVHGADVLGMAEFDDDHKDIAEATRSALPAQTSSTPSPWTSKASDRQARVPDVTAGDAKSLARYGGGTRWTP